MFAGLSNQVNSWMGAVKGEPQDEEVPSPTLQEQQEQQQQAELEHQNIMEQPPLEEVHIASESEEGVKAQRFVSLRHIDFSFHKT